MAFEFEKTEIEGLYRINPHIFADGRGIYKKCYEKNVYDEFGIANAFTERSDLISVKGALRGLHFQERFSQAKLIHVVSGVIYDVAVDLRVDSSTFGCCHEELMRAEDNYLLFIPEGFAHGFITLSDEAIFSYQCTGKYDPDSCGGIIWNDVDLNIKWPLKEYGINKVICTEKDRNWPTLKEYCRERLV